MQIVNIRKNAKLKKDDDGQYWLMIDTSTKLHAMFNLSLSEFDDVLEAFMEDQEAVGVESFG